MAHWAVYPDGRVCISILHPPGHDEMSGELPEERWLPTQTVSTVMLSVLSMLNDPNFSSPANVDASVQWRRDSAGYKKRVRSLIEKANRQLPAHVRIPHPDTDPEERRRAVAKLKVDHQSSHISVSVRVVRVLLCGKNSSEVVIMFGDFFYSGYGR